MGGEVKTELMRFLRMLCEHKNREIQAKKFRLDILHSSFFDVKHELQIHEPSSPMQMDQIS